MGFVLTCGRCGTVFISDALGQCPGITTCHERNAKILRILQNVIRNGKPVHIAGRIGTAMVRRRLQSLEIDCVHWEVNLPLRSFLTSVAACFPEAMFVHIVRDPRDHVRSGVNWAEQHPVNRWFKLHMPFWSEKPPAFVAGARGTSARDRIFGIAAWNWYASNTAYSDLENIVSNYSRLYFEDLKADPVHFLNRMLDIAGYPCDEGRALLPSLVTAADRNASQGNFPSWPEWPDEYINVLDRMCGPLMQKYGYGQEKEWHERLTR